MTAESSPGPRLGIDIGGTTITVAVTDGQGGLQVLEHGEVGVRRGVADLLDHALALAATALGHVDLDFGQVAGVGLALPGEVEMERGLLRASPILSAWRNVPVRDLVRERTGVPVVIENDANAALLAERHWGAARDVDSALLITIGTGIGGAVMCGGRILRGSQGSAGEVGHVSVETSGERCWCGGVGCLGLYASTTALLADYARRRGAAGGCATGREFASRYRQDDADAHAALERMGHYLARGIAAAVSVVAPEKVILFGGILDSLAEPLVATTAAPLRRRSYPMAIPRVRLEAARLGGKAGALGASLLPEASAADEQGRGERGSLQEERA